MTAALKRDHQLREEVGRGRFGVVFRSISYLTRDSFAVKSIDKNRLLLTGDSLDSRCLLTEPKILLLVCSHPNVITLHRVYEDDSYLHMVLDLCSSRDLHQRIVACGTFREAECRAIMSQLMDAISHIHRLGVVHRDVKPENVMFDSKEVVKLADFGSAEAFVEGEAASMRGIVGTPYYVAPEVLAGREYGEKVDVWSAGVMMYIMLAGFPPFYGESTVETFEAVLRANLRYPVRVFQSVSGSAKDLMRRMLCKDVSTRFSADQVLKHPWMTASQVD